MEKEKKAPLTEEVKALLAEVNDPYANDNYENDFDDIIIFKINENNHLQDEIFVA